MALHIPVRVAGQHAVELQLHSKDDVAKVLKNKTLLDTMRYVDAKVTITTQHVVVKTAVAPIGLLFWLALALLLVSLFRKRIKESIPPANEFRSVGVMRAAPDETSHNDWWLLVWVIVGIVLLIAIIHYHIWLWILVASVLFLLVRYYKEIFAVLASGRNFYCWHASGLYCMVL